MDNTTTTQTPAGLPRIGSPAPQFEAVTTHGVLKLEDFKGSWLVLFSHPADFTPVCTTEFIGFAEIHSKLRGMNVELMGLSIDSVYSHIAWVRNIEEKFGRKITFPIIADLNKEVATLCRPAGTWTRSCALSKRSRRRTNTVWPPQPTGVPAIRSSFPRPKLRKWPRRG